MLGRKVAVSFLFLWAGLLIGISFLEAPLKFQAPGISLELGLGIGRLIFAALNKLELIAATIIFISSVEHFKNYGVALTLFFIAGLLLLMQTFFLLPLLDARAEAIQMNKQVLPSSLHTTYIITEVTKLILIVSSGILLQKDFGHSKN